MNYPLQFNGIYLAKDNNGKEHPVARYRGKEDDCIFEVMLHCFPPKVKPKNIEGIAFAELLYNHLHKKLPVKKDKCWKCGGTGRYTWTDYSNGQGLDIDREEDCDACED